MKEFAYMKVVSVELNHDMPSYYGKYKVGIINLDNNSSEVEYEYCNLKRKINDVFRQEIGEFNYCEEEEIN